MGTQQRAVEFSLEAGGGDAGENAAWWQGFSSMKEAEDSTGKDHFSYVNWKFWNDGS